ncbi:MAG: FKBP-type peptidyl-prolyl cis-trans isomerase [Edaphobacter sp.]
MTLKLSSITLLAAATAVATAQTKPTTPAPHPAEPACATVPELSPKIPALPAGAPCAKPLYTVTIEPGAKLSYIAPIESEVQLRQTLGIESSTFSLSYIDTQVGTGELAVPHKWYTIHYTGYLVDGTKFDSSLEREPISINYGQHQVIPGWDTGFDGMRVGGKRRLFIPYQLAYGAQGKPPIPPKAELIFDVELISQTDEKPAPKPAPAPAPAAAPATPPAGSPATTPNPKDE